MDELDNIYRRIISIKKKYNLTNLYEGNKLEIKLNDLYESMLLQEHILSNVKRRVIKYDKKNNTHGTLYDLFATLFNIAPDSLFIKEASEHSGINLEDIIALIHIESRGREFSVSRKGAINRLQLNPKCLDDIYRYVTSRDNLLDKYIIENTTKENFLHDLVSNSKLNIFTGINYFKYLKDTTHDECESIVAYCYGPSGASDLLEEKDGTTIRYYNDFLEARDNLNMIKEFAFSDMIKEFAFSVV